ncbi:MAG: serine/threonine-protein kinase, partial [Bradymonadaceae bacterium]
NLSHPGIVEVIDYGETPDRILYMVMEFIEGRTLEQEVSHQGKFSVDESLSVTRQIASALHAAHGAGVIHRDLKPANIMLISTTAGYTVKVLDFGMAKLFARLGDESIVALTRERVAVGTPRYIAPEQARGSKDVGPWTDVYALGLLLYEMLTSTKAVQHDSVESAVAAHVDPNPLELAELESFPNGVRQLLRAMVKKDRDQRLQSAEQVLFRINQLAESPLEQPQKTNPSEVVGPPMGADTADSPPSSSANPPPSTGPPPAQSQPPPRPGDHTDGGQPHPPESGPSNERRARAGGASPFPKAAEEESLELDWNDPNDRATDEDLPDAAGEFDRKWRQRSSRLAFGIGGAVVAAVIATLTFMVIAAQFHDFGPVLRAVLGLLPVGIGAMTALGSPSGLRRWHFLRNSLIYCGIGFVVVHVMGPVRLARQLWNDPVWFLEPLEFIPGVDYLAAFLTSIAQSYATIIVSIFGSGHGLG